MVRVDPNPGLDGDGNPEFIRSADRCPDDGAEAITLVWQYTAPAFAGHLGDRTAEIEIDVVDTMASDQSPRGLRHDLRVNAVELH